MPFGRSAEEKAADHARKLEEEAAQQREQQARAQAAATERQRQAFLMNPVGQATTAKEQKQGFFETQLEVGLSQRDVQFGGPDYDRDSRTTSHAGTLSAIEAVGWRLEHASYVFMVTGETSREHVFMSGDSTAVSGKTVGIYLFRNTD
ncbi:MAG: hypothetical protein ACR2KG_05500 [Nocardioidaceae bacterium]